MLDHRAEASLAGPQRFLGAALSGDLGDQRLIGAGQLQGAFLNALFQLAADAAKGLISTSSPGWRLRLSAGVVLFAPFP